VKRLKLTSRCAAGLLLLGGLLAWGGTVREPRDVSEQELQRIQLECLRAYPRDLVKEMTEGGTRIPAALEKTPDKVWGTLAPVTMKKGEFFPAVLQEILPMLTRQVTPEQKFLDLGSGDGRVVFLANLLGADAYGIEYEKELVDASLRAQGALSDLVEPRRAHFLKGDFFEYPWSEYDVIFYFNLSSFDQGRVLRKLASEMKPEAKLIVASSPAALEGFDVVDQGGGVSVFRKAVK
jgi:SAM-dependent methyltransferase